MIAYLEGKNTTVEVPDDTGEKELGDIQQNFEKYIQPEQQPKTASSPSPASQQPLNTTVDVPETPIPTGIPGVNVLRRTIQPEIPKWVPNFYESYIKPTINSLGPFGLPAQLESLPEEARGPLESFATSSLKSLTGGLAKPLLSGYDTEEKDHPIASFSGQLTGGLGSLLATGGALKIAGLGEVAEQAGTAGVEAGMASAQRYLPRAIMTGATFGTQAFVAHTIKAFQDGNVDLAQFGKDIMLQTAGGAAFGAIGGVANVPLSVASAGGLGFVMSKMEGGDNREAVLSAGLFAGFEMVGSFGKNKELINEGLKHVEDSIDDYVKAKDPTLNPNGGMGKAIVTLEAQKYGGIDELAKKENALQLIEDINQKIRQGQVPNSIQTVEPQAQLETKNVPEEQFHLKPDVAALERGEKIEATPSEKTEPLSSSQSAQTLMDAGLRASHPSIQASLAGPVKSLYDVAQTPGVIFPPTEISSKESIANHPDFIQLTKDAEAVTRKYADLLGIPPTAQLGEAIFRAIHTDQHKTMRAIQAASTPEEIQKIKQDFEARWPDADREFATLHSKLYTDVTEGWFKRNEAGKYGSMRPKVALDLESKSYDEVQKEIDQREDEIEKQGIDVIKTPIEKLPQDLQQLYKQRDLIGEKELSLNVHEISSNFKSIGLNDNEINNILDHYALGNTSVLGQYLASKYTSKLVNQPIEKQKEDIYLKLAVLRDIDTGGEIDQKTMDDANKIVNQLQNYFKPQLKNGLPDLPYPDYDIAQIAYNHGLIEEPSVDLLKTEYAKTGKEPLLPKFGSKPETSFVKPELPEVSSAINDSINEIKTIVNPANAAPLAAQITREQLGQMARSYDKAEASLETAKKFFDKQPTEKLVYFIDKMEHGQDQKDSKLNDISKTLRNLFDEKRKEVQALGKGKLESFIENYFPHIWDKSEKEISQEVMKAAKRPLEGSKSFLKKRTIEFFKQGIRMGLTPVSYNPVDLTLLKMREMDKYIMAHRTINAYKENGLAQYVGVGKDHPEGWIKIDDRISTVFKSPMVAVQEAFDEKMMQDLIDVAKNLGIDLKRSVTVRGEGKKLGDVWGLSMSNPLKAGEPGKIWTKFAGPESALAHELGHQLDHIYGLQEKFLSDSKINSELTELANKRLRESGLSGTKYDEKFIKYIQKPEEKMAVLLEAYIHAPDLLKEIAPTAYTQLTLFLKSDPKLEPLTQIKPSLIMGVGQSEVYAGGSVIAGHIWAQPDAARIINNYLSPGLQKSAIYRTFRYAGNVLNQFQLGFSAFHLGFTSMDAIVSKSALALNQLFSGHPIKSIQAALTSPFAPVSNIIRGDKLMKAWRGEGQSPVDEIMAQAMVSGGGRARMDQFYATKAYDQMKKYFQAGKPIRGILHLPLMIAEASSKPILEYIVPRQKLGVFSDIMKMEMENNPNMSHEKIREIAQRAWDSVDNRMGQLVYDNIFWNRTFKDLLMASVRSVGWNLGTIRELGGGVKDAAKTLTNLARGRKSDLSYRTAYLMALPFVAGLFGAIYQYLRTGKGPEELKDYYFPKTGGVDANGNENRVSPPTYMKDIYHYTTAPIKTISNKLNPLLAIIGQMLSNKDYYGVKIRNEDDPIVKQALSDAAFILKQMEPFGFRNMRNQQQTGNRSLTDVIQPWIGITPAPYDINQTKAEKLAHEIAASHQAIGGRTQAQADKSRLIGDLTRRYRSNDPTVQDDLIKAYQEGKISRTQMRDVIIHANMTSLQRLTQHFSLEEMERVYDKATDEEKAQIQRQLDRKIERTRVPVEAP